MHLHYIEVDLDEGRRQSKMVANSKSHAISQMAYARANDHLGDGMWRDVVKEMLMTGFVKVMQPLLGRVCYGTQ